MIDTVTQLELGNYERIADALQVLGGEGVANQQQYAREERSCMQNSHVASKKGPVLNPFRLDWVNFALVREAELAIPI